MPFNSRSAIAVDAPREVPVHWQSDTWETDRRFGWAPIGRSEIRYMTLAVSATCDARLPPENTENNALKLWSIVD